MRTRATLLAAKRQHRAAVRWSLCSAAGRAASVMASAWKQPDGRRSTSAAWDCREKLSGLGPREPHE